MSKKNSINLKDTISLFTLAYTPVHIIKNIVAQIKSIKWIYQRAKYGVSSYDSWDFDAYLTVTIENGLKFLKDAGNSHPCWCTFEEWQMKLQYMIKLAEICNLDELEATNDSWEKYLEVSKDHSEDSEEVKKARAIWLEDSIEFDNLREKAKKKLFIELSKYSSDLWD